MNRILIVAHAPLAHALRDCALHVFPDLGDVISGIDVQPDAPPQESLAAARSALAGLGASHVLVLTDVFGATPCNVAQQLVDGQGVRLVAGVNLPMLLRALSYRDEPLDAMAERAIAGGEQGIMPIPTDAASPPPPHQPGRSQP